jgi:outer membrane protein TolC
MPACWQAVLLILVQYFCIPMVSAEPLPTPLTLEQALAFSDANHPELLLADANLASAVSRQLETESSNDVDAYIEIAPYTSYPTTSSEFTNDSYLRFSVSKTLYDFGYSDSMQESADESVLSQELIAADARNKNHLKIMRLYFDVLLADLHYATVDEEMTTLYVRYDKLKDQQSLGMVSDVEVGEAEIVYRDVADRRKQSEIEQRVSRQRLAIALNRPDDLPSELIRPELSEYKRSIPEVDTLLAEALNNNLTLLSLEHAVLADRAALKATEKQFGPTLAAGVQLNEYERNLSGRNNASIGLNLRIPLTNSSRTHAESARATAALSKSQANYELAKYSIRQKLSEIIGRLEMLQYKRTTAELRLDSRALSLEKSRARYELEIKTTLGDSMAKYTEAEWLAAKNDFDIALAWAQIETLTGKKLYQSKSN